jgi:hypothetical protein
MRVYVDRLAVYFTFTNSINTKIFITSGQHQLELTAEDKQGYISPTILNTQSLPNPRPASATFKACPDGNPAPLSFLPDPVATHRSAPQAWALPSRP